MLPLRIAILWHQHQPYYNLDAEFFLPWVRLHAVKDYLDIVLLSQNYPKLRQTFNLVPSMLLQLDEYLKYGVQDKIQKLTNIEAVNLTYSEKTQILESFFVCNYENMIKPYPRYDLLFNKAKTNNNISDFTSQDWLDLQVWYNLTWIGPISRKADAIKSLFDKGSNFTEVDKITVMDYHFKLMADVVQALRSLKDSGQAEISVSPFYHPILPLLINSETMHEAMPDALLPNPCFQRPEDASRQIKDAIEYYKSIFGDTPKGMWPSEGSVSDSSIDMIAECGIQWLATDENILLNSLPAGTNKLERFFPRKFKSGGNETIMFFRDHFLSDLIGFQYSGMNPETAATDFINRLKYVRWEIASNYSEEALRYAVVPIILDGENCWEFYPENGVHFLTALFGKLSDDTELQTITFSKAVSEKSHDYREPISHIRAGSWINSNFDIWMGEAPNVRAWELLGQIRTLAEERKSTIEPKLFHEIMNEIYIAEGSDWFWWYCSYHSAPNKPDFDIVYRKRIANIYKMLGLDIPDELNSPISSGEKKDVYLQPAKNQITPDISLGWLESDWHGCSIFNAKYAQDAMHSSSELLSRIYFGNDTNTIYLGIRLNDSINDDLKLKIEINNSIIVDISGFKYELSHDGNISGFEIKRAEKELLIALGFETTISNTSQFSISVYAGTSRSENRYPRQGAIVFEGI